MEMWAIVGPSINPKRLGLSCPWDNHNPADALVLVSLEPVAPAAILRQCPRAAGSTWLMIGDEHRA